MIRIPASFTAGRKVTINGTTYQPGDAVPNAVVKTIKNLSSLLSRRFIVPNVDPHRRRSTKFRLFGPADLGNSKIRKLL